MKKGYKNTTLKEFWEVLEKAGMYKENWELDGILNLICCELNYSVHELEENGCEAAAKSSNEKSKIIFNYLFKKGYFER